MICAHPRCTDEIVTPFKAKMRADVYHSAKCRERDTRRLIQLRRRAEHPTQKQYERRLKLLKKYGITEIEWEMFYVTQNGRCAICAVDLVTVKVCVDHNHQTGEVRGLLCNTCNQGLGYFGDNPGRLRVAIAYLQQGAAKAAEQGEEVLST